MRLIAVILGAPSNPQRFAQAAKLMEWGFDQFTTVSLLRSGQPLPVHVQVHQGPLIQPVASSDLKLVVRKTDAANVRVVYDVQSAIDGPITTGEPLGRVIAHDEGQAATEIMAISPIAFTAPHTLGGEAYNASAPPSSNPSQENQ
jgi:D-alanyl-D-alanine carboxypeptidase (penicillin-binding protein 5/6)